MTCVLILWFAHVRLHSIQQSQGRAYAKLYSHAPANKFMHTRRFVYVEIVNFTFPTFVATLIYLFSFGISLSFRSPCLDCDYDTMFAMQSFQFMCEFGNRRISNWILTNNFKVLANFLIRINVGMNRRKHTHRYTEIEIICQRMQKHMPVALVATTRMIQVSSIVTYIVYRHRPPKRRHVVVFGPLRASESTIALAKLCVIVCLLYLAIFWIFNILLSLTLKCAVNH